MSFWKQKHLNIKMALVSSFARWLLKTTMEKSGWKAMKMEIFLKLVSPIYLMAIKTGYFHSGFLG